jgi:aminopeptidase N
MNLIKYSLSVLLLIFLCQHSLAQSCQHKNHFDKGLKTSAQYNLRSDTVDVLRYKMELDFSDYTNQLISGNCEVVFEAKMNNIATISLDLLQMTIDSVKQNGIHLTSSYDDTLMIVSLNTNLNAGNKDSITVYYQGTPQLDPSGFGGFYFQGAYAYNIGVAFSAEPHNYGRTWHPCFDNFVERATYQVHIKSPINTKGYANGLITADSTDGINNYRTWKINQEIPTYLATVAVSNYTHVEQTFTSALNSATIPMYLIAAPNDTANMKSSFVNLTGAMNAFETDYGPYLWDKVGFHLVPFSSGAMEHATDITYPIVTADGSLSYETLMAHELSHHWWGDLVTCRTSEDMWINEGMASFSERIFLEHIYGYERYINDVKANHKNVLQNAHINDGGYYPLSGVPHDVTYGDHSYNKGSDMAHTLRGYMGDADFFNVLQSFLDVNKFKDVDALDFRDHITANSPFDATDFFNDWIFNPGFPAFYVDSTVVIPNGAEFDVTVYVHQKLNGTSQLDSNVPLQVSFLGSNWELESDSLIASGEYSNFIFTLPFNPIDTYLNGDDHIMQAVTAQNEVISSNGTKDLTYPLFRYITSSVTDSSLVRIEHYWVAPDPIKDVEQGWLYELSQDRFWRVSGILSSGYEASARVFFNGKNVGGGNLDVELVNSPGFTEDSLFVMYRENAGDEWSPTSATISHLGSHTDGYGYFNIDTLH